MKIISESTGHFKHCFVEFPLLLSSDITSLCLNTLYRILLSRAGRWGGGRKLKLSALFELCGKYGGSKP